MARDAPTIERWLDGPAATQALAALLAPHLVAGDVVALCGELGSGKTTFARALINALGSAEPVPSPTFTLAQIFETATAPLRGRVLWGLGLVRAGFLALIAGSRVRSRRGARGSPCRDPQLEPGVPFRWSGPLLGAVEAGDERLQGALADPELDATSTQTLDLDDLGT